MLDTLRSVTREDLDDLEKLRRMIKNTQSDLKIYGGDTYDLNKLVDETTKNFEHHKNISTIKNKIQDNFFTLHKNR